MEERKEFDDQQQRSWYSSWEEQCYAEQNEAEAMRETQFKRLEKNIDQRLWHSFQNTASAISQLYKDRMQDNVEDPWQPFQNSALNATTLYKDALDSCSQQSELAFQCGIQRRNKEILMWLRKKKRHIRREELISYLCGKSPPHRSPTSGNRGNRSPPLVRSESNRNSPKRDGDLQEFQEAVAMHGLYGAMAGISVHSMSGGQQSPQQTNSTNIRHRQKPGVYRGDLTSFISEEFRRRKNERPSTSRGRSESPTSRKRSGGRSPVSSPDYHNPKRTKKH